MQLTFATNNRHKLEEIRAALSTLPVDIELQSLSDLGCTDEIPETEDTLEGNARQKARYIYEKYGVNCFADDTGLEIEALDGRPGVYSARYAGENCSFADNVNKVLLELEGISNRNAIFRTVICLIINNEDYYFEGIVKGRLTTESHGKQGFGYDPIFIPDGKTMSFAEMEMEEKNNISHRGEAVRKLMAFLGQYS